MHLLLQSYGFHISLISITKALKNFVFIIDCTLFNFYSSRRHCLGEPRMLFASCLVLSWLESLAMLYHLAVCVCVCVNVKVGSSVCRVSCQLQHWHVVCVSWIPQIVSFFGLLQFFLIISFQVAAVSKNIVFLVLKGLNP